MNCKLLDAEEVIAVWDASGEVESVGFCGSLSSCSYAIVMRREKPRTAYDLEPKFLQGKLAQCRES